MEAFSFSSILVPQLQTLLEAGGWRKRVAEHRIPPGGPHWTETFLLPSKLGIEPGLWVPCHGKHEIHRARTVQVLGCIRAKDQMLDSTEQRLMQ